MAIAGRNQERGQQAAESIAGAGGRADFLAADLTDASAARDLADRTTEVLGGHVDILVNAAGILSFGPTTETDEASFDAAYALNVKAPYFLTAALAPGMAARGHGAIVNVTTMVAEFGAAGMGLYGSTKAALRLLTKSWAAEYGPSGVRVNAVSPGPTRTEGTASMGQALDQLAAAGPAGRPGTPRRSPQPSST